MAILRNNLDLVSLFGKDRAQEDENLKYYFVKTKQYEEIKRGDKELVLGRKGAGKSALFSMLSKEAEEDENTIPVKISFSGEDFVYIENLLKKESFSEPLNDDYKYSLAWKNFILSEIIYASIPYIDFDKSLKQKLISENIISESVWKRFARSLLSVFKKGKLHSSFAEIELDFSELSFLSSDDKEKFKTSLDDLIQNNSFIVVIDNLDEPWKNNDSMNSWLRGLVFAIRQLKRDYNNLKLVAFFRTDIYEIISKESDLFDSKSEITTISWDDNNYYSLRQLVAARIAHYIGKDYPTSLSDINLYWNMFFPVKLKYNKKNREPKFLSYYLIERTFQRPRELLQFCRLIIEKSKRTNLPVEVNSISSAEIEYSNWKLLDLAGEYSKACSNIDKCILSFAGTKSTWDWSCAELLNHFESLDPADALIDSITKTQYSPKESIEFLYRIGFFRKVISKPETRTRYKMYHQDNTIVYNKTIFDIHPAFRKKFTMS